MQNNSSSGSCALLARGFAALCATLALGLGMASRAVAAPFAYVANHDSKNVSVIDTATNKVMATIPVGHFPNGVAVTPDGKHVYVTNDNPDDSFPVIVVVIDTATNKVVARIPLDDVAVFPTGIAISPDGKFAYVASDFLDLSSGILWQIDTATNKAAERFEMDQSFFNGVAVAPNGTVHVTLDEFELAFIYFGFVDGVEVAGDPAAVAVAPDGKHLYVGSSCKFLCGNPIVWEIDPAASTVVATIPMEDYPNAIAITPDGTRAYVPTSGAVSVINTATNKVVATVPVGGSGIAITPDGKYAYLAGGGVSVIDTATNSVVATIPVGNNAVAVGIVPPPPTIPFSVFTAKLEIHIGHKPNTDHFNLNASFTLGSTSNGISPPTEPVTLKVGTFTATIPPGSFKGKGFGPFQFEGLIGGVRLEVGIEPTGAKRYAFHANTHDANLAGTTNPVAVTLTIGDDSGMTSVKADIDH